MGKSEAAICLLTFIALTAARRGVCKRAPLAWMYFSFSLAKETRNFAACPPGPSQTRHLWHRRPKIVFHRAGDHADGRALMISMRAVSSERDSLTTMMSGLLEFVPEPQRPCGLQAEVRAWRYACPEVGHEADTAKGGHSPQPC